MSSKRRIAANRRNAQKSTGPRTRKGKARSSQNGVRHGLLSRETVLAVGPAPENHREFDHFVLTVVEKFDPQSPLERILVDRIAACYWRLRRAQRFENDALARRTEAKRDKTPAAADLRNARKRLDTALYLLESLDTAAIALRDNPDPLLPDGFDHLSHILHAWAEFNTRPNLDEATRATAGRIWLDHFRALGFDDARIRSELTQVCSEFASTQHALVEQYRCQVSAAERRLDSDAATLQPASMPEDDDLERLVRYESMIDREVHRLFLHLYRLRRCSPPPRNPANAEGALNPEITQTTQAAPDTARRARIGTDNTNPLKAVEKPLQNAYGTERTQSA